MPANFAVTPTSTTTLPANSFPVSAVFVPGTASGNLTALQGGPASTDSNNYTSAPMAVYAYAASFVDGADATIGATTDASSANTLIGLTKAIKANTASVVIGSGTVTANQGGSWSVTANAGTNLNTSALALDTSVNGVIVAQGSTTSGQKGPLLQGAVTTAAPSYTTAQTSPISLTPAGAVRVDASATTQPVSGTITANIGTTNGLALDATVAKLNVAQGTALGSNTGPLLQASVTTGSPTYSTGNINPLSLTTAGALRTDASATTQPVSGTVTANAGTGTFNIQSNASVNLNQVAGSAVATAATGIAKVGLTDGSGNAITSTSNAIDVNIKSGGGSGFSVVDEAAWTAATSAFVPAGGVFNDSAAALTSGQQGTTRLTNNRAIHVNLRDASANQLLGSKTSANSIPVVIASDQGAVTISGTITANAGTNLNTSALALDTSVNGLLLAQASTTSGQKGPLMQGAVTTNAPSYTTAQSDPLSLDTSGLLRASLKDTPSNTNNFNVNIAASAITQAVSGTVTANQGTANATPWNENIAQVGGSTVATAATGTMKMGIVGNAGATMDAAVGAGTAPTNAVVVGAIYNSTAPAPTSGQSMAMQLDQAGNTRTFPGIALATLSAWSSGTSLNATQTIFSNSGSEAVLVQLTQTTTLTGGAVTFEVSYDGSNWFTIPANCVLDPTSNTFAQISVPYTVQANTNKAILLNMNGAQGLRIKLSTQITGTGTVTPNYALLPASPADTIIALSPTAANFLVTATQGGTWTVQPVAGTTGGSTPSHTVSGASTNATNVKNAAGLLYGYTISNTNAAARYVKFYDKATSPTVGTDTPKQTTQIPANGTVIRVYPLGLAFSLGIGFGTTTGVTDADTGAVGANDLVIDLDYK